MNIQLRNKKQHIYFKGSAILFESCSVIQNFDGTYKKYKYFNLVHVRQIYVNAMVYKNSGRVNSIFVSTLRPTCAVDG